MTEKFWVHIMDVNNDMWAQLRDGFCSAPPKVVGDGEQWDSCYTWIIFKL